MTLAAAGHTRALSLAKILGDEGFRLFFPLGALYAALWPLQWVLVFGLDLPLARTTRPAFGMRMMIFGAFGAALIGFITTAVPEWTDMPRPRGKFLFPMAALWGGGRLVGFLGADALGWLGALCDTVWLVLLTGYVVQVSLRKRTDTLFAFIFWIGALAAGEIAVRYAFLTENVELAQRMVHCAGLVFLALLGLALARITVAVTNLVLDPSEATSPFRPHPGRLNLAPGLVALAVAGDPRRRIARGQRLSDDGGRRRLHGPRRRSVRRTRGHADGDHGARGFQSAGRRRPDHDRPRAARRACGRGHGTAHGADGRSRPRRACRLFHRRFAAYRPRACFHARYVACRLASGGGGRAACPAGP